MHYVGIDVSKRSLDVCLLAEGSKGSRKTKTLSNGQDSAQNLAMARILIPRLCRTLISIRISKVIISSPVFRGAD